MTSPLPDPICVRNSLLDHILMGRRNLFDGDKDHRQITKDGLIDAILVLHDYFGSLPKKDVHMINFVEHYQAVVSKLRKIRVNVADFEQKKVIGRGHFGEVHLVKEKQTGHVYAMKVIKKSDTLAKQNIAFYEEEKDIMAKAKSEWLTSLHCSFQDQENLYFVMEFHPGGDLLSLLGRRDGTMSEDEARFYLAEMILALHTLHSMGYVHRDIKPENVLLDRLGHIKLADFGSSAKLDSTGVVRNEMAVGTPEYIAPEVLTSMNKIGLLAGGYGVECDYWSLGIMAYEMVYGSTPFGAEKMSNTYGNIMNFKESFKFPQEKAVSAEFTSLISNLICDSKARLGYQKLMQHPFFASIDWNGLREKSPPYIPVITSLDDTSNFDDFDNEGSLAHSTINMCYSQEVSGRNLPFIGFTYVKESSVITQIDATSASNEYVKKIGELEMELDNKNKEIQDLRKQRLQYEQEKSKQWNTDLLNQKINRLEHERDTLEKQLARAQRDAEQHRRALEQEKAERLKNETKVIEMIKDLKRNWEKLNENQRNDLQKEIQVWKQANSDTQSKADELAELLKAALDTVAKLEEDCNHWKARSRQYKELAARGHRVGEKRASICVAPPTEALVQAQQQLERERNLKTELKEKIQELEDRIRSSEVDFGKRLEEEERRWITQSTDREAEYQGRIIDLEEKILKQKENRIKELENNLKIQLSECQKLRDRSEQLQKSLDDTLQSKTGLETSFTVREGELEKRVKQLETDLKSAADMRLELQKQVTEISHRETMHLQKYENIVVDMREAVERLERKNKDLVEQLSSYESSHISNSSVVPEVEELKQKVVFLESQISKLEQQLERSRENLTLEREKARTTQADLWKKEKELSDAKIDLRIANRENKTNEESMNKLQEEAKLWEGKLKTKDEEIELKQTELIKIKSEFAEKQRLLAEKEKAQADCEKNLEEANKTANTARELRRELQFVKDEMAINQRLKTTLESEVQRAEDRVTRYMEEKKEIQALLEEEKKKVQAGEKDLALLKETMMIMDEQLQAFDNMVEGTDKKQSEFEVEKAQLSQEIERLKQEIRTAKQQVNEEKSLKLFTESRLRDVESRLNTCETDTESRIAMLQKEVSEKTAMINQLNAQVSELDQQLADADLSVNSLDRKVAVLEDDNVKLQEESSALRTQLISVKNSNAVLSEGLEQAISKAEAYKNKIIQIEAQIETTTLLYKERELKYDSTIAQQTKLIDFLQVKAEQPRKKPTLTDKLFGSHKKENQPSIPLAYRELESNLEKKTSQCRLLTEQLNKCKAEIAALKSDSTSSGRSYSGKDLTKTPTAGHEMKCHAATPIPHRALSRLTQSPGTQQASPSTSSIGLASQRMHHNIPHRLQSQMVMRATNCAVCLDSIHFGRQVSVCQDCGASAHAKCASHLPSTCGLPMGLAEHFGSVLGQEMNNPQGESIPSSSFHMKGWVKIPRPGKATCWDRKFMKLNGTKLCIYDHEPSSDNMQPVDTFDLRPTDGSGVAIHSAVAQSEVFATAKTDVPYMFMIESVPLTTCWPGRTLFILALSFEHKKAWVSALEAVTQGESNRQSAIQAHRKPKLVLRLDNPLDVNCIVPISEGILLIGAKEGLFSYRLHGNRKDLVKIDGVTNVQQIVLVTKLSAVLMIVGDERQLVLTELRVLKGCADTIQSAQPTLEVEAVANCEDCHLFEVSDLEKDDIFLCAANQDRVKLFKWNTNNSSFVLRKELIVSETCSCIHFTEHSVLVGCDRFYEVDLGNYSAEEFLDASDASLAYVVFGLKQVHSFPVAILEVTPKRGEIEFLLCYHEFGIFVDGYGRRSRSEDVKWTRLPLAFAYRGPYLFVLHFNSVEVMRLTSTSFKAVKSEKPATSPNDSEVSQESVAPPPSVFIEMPSPRYLGPAPEPGSNYFFSNDNKVMDIVQLEAPVVLGEKNGVQPVHLDDISLSGSEFSITPSLAQILDQSDSSIESSSTQSSLPSSKRTPSSAGANPAKNKRVKFESDL